MEIRDITEEDLPTIVRLSQAMHADSTFSSMDFDPLVIGRTLLELMTRDNGLAITAEHEGRLVGMLGAFVMPCFFGKEQVAEDVGLFVIPDKRGSLAASALIRRYLAWAKERGAKRVTLANSAGTEDVAFQKLCGRLGMQRAGSVMYLTEEY